MRRETVLMIWIGGLVLAVLLYLIGPDRFLDACMDLFESIDVAFRNMVAALGTQTYAVVRALAIAIYVVFAVLAFLAAQRGHRGFWALTVVSAVFLLLIWRPYGIYPAPLSRWVGALAVAIVGAVMMTQRLTVEPVRRDNPPPYPPGRAP